jgi:Cof subfamily protein (haloacid dehalogenase superfamily)
MIIKAICTDIDGTLLNKDREISQRTIMAFQALPGNFPVILASSRMPSAMRHLLADLGRPDNPLICYNGGFILGSASGTPKENILDSTTIPLETCKQIVLMSAGSGIHLSLYLEDEWHAPTVDFWTKREETATKVSASILPNMEVLGHWEKRNKGAHKVMCMGDAKAINILYEDLINSFSQSLHLYRSKDTYIEIAPKAISKASALSEVLGKAYDIKMEEVMAFGDNFNDVELIRSVGFGVAVANAKKEVKAVADKITLKNTEDGVALAIEQYLL